MSKANQTLLNGAYYALPNPSDQTHNEANPIHRQPRLRRLLKVVIHTVIALGLTAFILGLVLRPHKIKVYVVTATMNQFDLTDGNKLHYNLTIDLVFRNPNKRASVYYDWLHASSFYEGNRFGWVQLPGFYEGHKSVTAFQRVFEGESVMAMKGWRLEKFARDRREGFFDVKVRVYAWIRYKIGCFKTKHRMAKITCRLNRVALAANENSSGVGFRGTRCDVDL